ncbi:MAG: hypothetical protein GWP66_01140 [Gammaproteobacteria bacterium]|jgi:hypothetical protein|nr:hypothetical protein [Gammaproteobacteria bacterium]
MKVLALIVALLVGAWAWLFLSNKGVLVASEMVTEDRVGKFTESLGFTGISMQEQRLVCTYFTGIGMVKRSHSLLIGEQTCLNVVDLRE